MAFNGVKDDRRVVVDGFNLDINVYKYESNIIIHLCNIDIGILDKEEKTTQIRGRNYSKPDNIKFIFIVDNTKFVVTVKGVIRDTKYSDDDYMIEYSFTNFVIVKAFRLDNLCLNPNSIFLVHDEIINFNFNFHTIKHINVVSKFFIVINGCHNKRDPNFNGGMLVVLADKKRSLECNNIINKKYGLRQQDFEAVKKLNIDCTSYTTMNDIDQLLDRRTY